MTGGAGHLAELLSTTRAWEPVQLPEPVPVTSIPTPALLLDADAMERNIARMSRWVSDHGIGFRPHGKTHKCPIIAHAQLAAGAVGVCVAKVGEAEAFRAAGIERILITSPVVTVDKVARTAALMARSEAVMVVVDSDLGATMLSEAAAARSMVADVLIDLDPDMGRTGVSRDERALALARRVADDPHLRLRGLQHYCGHVMHIEGHGPRAERSRSEWSHALAVRDRMVADGLAIEIVSGGGTGTFDIDCEISGITDLQVGSFIFMDQEYRLIGGPDSELFEAFEPSLFIETTAISAPREGGVTLDGGFKCMASDTVPPAALDRPDARFFFGGDEHGILRCRGDNAPPQLGERIRLLTPHCDPTVNLHDFYFVCRDDMVEELWPITARGRGW